MDATPESMLDDIPEALLCPIDRPQRWHLTVCHIYCQKILLYKLCIEGQEEGGFAKRTSAPAILFSPDSIALSEAGGSSAYSAPRGMVIELGIYGLTREWIAWKKDQGNREEAMIN